MNIIVKQDEQTLAQTVAEAMAAYINAHPGALLCFAAGDTPLSAFRALIELQKDNKVDLTSVYYVGLDEWVGLGAETRGSCVQVMYDNYYTPAGIPADHVRVFDGLNKDVEQEKTRIQSWIDERGGIDFTLLGIGMNGHIGFNEPYSGLKDGCIYIELDDTTKSVSKKYFDTPLPVEYGIGVGAGELKKADTVFLMASGAKKAEIVKKTTQTPDEAVPSSLLNDHLNVTLFIDEAAASLL